MRAWESVAVPALPGAGSGVVSLVNTSTGELQATHPAADGARLYVCGITPYDAAHLGHAATYVAFDLLNRAWRDAGHAVRYTQNITDVDDPLLERAQATGDDWEDLATREIELFRRDMQALAVLPPDDYVGVVESIDLVADFVATMRERDLVYAVDGDLYFEVHRDPSFGAVAGLDVELMHTLFAERGGDPQRPGKRNPLDCLLWLAARPGEPSWPSPFGPGRPGWHIECSAIARTHLGDNFDVQGGGSDLAFPHHEMSAAQMQACFGAPFAQLYAHAGMVGLDGEKMSKSKGNLVFVSRLREQGTEPAAIRTALLGHHYRSDWEWTAADLTGAEARLARWRERLHDSTLPEAERLLGALRAAVRHDLDGPRALAAVDGWAESAPVGAPSEAGRRLVCDSVWALLGIQLER